MHDLLSNHYIQNFILYLIAEDFNFKNAINFSIPPEEIYDRNEVSSLNEGNK